MPPGPGTNVVGQEVGIRSAEEKGLAALLVLGLALRVLMAWRFRVDSDEPQHLHVVWAWTHGLLPYRDVFDNHMPLFHLLSAPVLLAVGERPTAILWMRFLMLPQWCAALFLTALIGRRLFAPRVGAWSAVAGRVLSALLLLFAGVPPRCAVDGALALRDPDHDRRRAERQARLRARSRAGDGGSGLAEDDPAGSRLRDRDGPHAVARSRAATSVVATAVARAPRQWADSSCRPRS